MTSRMRIAIFLAVLGSIGLGFGCGDSDSTLNSPTAPTGAGAPAGTLADGGDLQREAAKGKPPGSPGGGGGGGGNDGEQRVVTFGGKAGGMVTANVKVDNASTLELANGTTGVSFTLSLNPGDCTPEGEEGVLGDNDRLTYGQMYQLLSGSGGPHHFGKLVVDKTAETSAAHHLGLSLNHSFGNPGDVVFWIGDPSYSSKAPPAPSAVIPK